ncbi:phage virion morphogenesis protein [Kingella negevensis]|uniref:phage virion morphogenesis protein n=1 Tax=Kingella negevensis TaxID=1522312 RepID=UPI002543069E|nr:phage virion morphogenesis protein [Kingella negevensis]WII93187.1 phage virion morphogenesis protein [Kingella negevensis]
MSINFEIKSDLGGVAQRLSLVHSLLGSDEQRKKLMGNIATVLENSTRKRFETKTLPNGSKWASWADSTRNSKKYRDRVESDRLLRDSSTLLKSLTRHASAQLAQVGSNRHYAPYLQLGTAKMPARPFFGIDETDRQDMNDVLQTWLMRIGENQSA